MADATTWSRRVAEWRQSGQSAADFAAGKDFSAGTLYHWARRLRGARRAPAIPLAKVVRAAVIRPRSSAPVVVEIAGARVHLSADFDREIFAAVVDMLEKRAQR